MSVLYQLLTQLKAEQQALKDSFVDSPCIDMPTYQRRVGEYHGLLKAEEQLLFLIRPKDDDEDRR